jgi:hypothetical protein
MRPMGDSRQATALQMGAPKPLQPPLGGDDHA